MDNKLSLCIKPLIVKKGNITFIRNNIQKDGPGNITFIRKNIQKDGPSTPATKVLKDLFREDILFETTDMYYLKGEYQRLLLINRFNIRNKHSRTIAKYFSKDGSVLEKTSDQVTELIGQDQFNTLFTALCSILDQNLKIRSIVALLTEKSKKNPIPEQKSSSMSDITPCPMKVLVENSCQTDEMRIEEVKPKRRIRKPVSPYIIQDNTLNTPTDKHKRRNHKKFIIDIPKYACHLESKENEKSISAIGKSLTSEQNTGDDSLATPSTVNSLKDLGYMDELHEGNSNDSAGKFSVLSETPTDPEILTNPMALISTAQSLNHNIDQHTKAFTENCVFVEKNGFRVPGTDITVPFKPEDKFHIATKDNLRGLSSEMRKKLLQHQLSIDYSHCLTVMDEDGNLPIHLAVINEDLELVSRQCLVLKMRGSSLDIPANGLTALQLAVQMELATIVARLVKHGAAPLRADATHRTSVHDAAERSSDVLRALLDTSRESARKILYDNEEFWKPEMEQQSDEELGNILMKHMCSMFDRHGYNPLMVASMLGLYENARVLLEHSPSMINNKMPTSGNTALYLAVAAACNASVERGNKSKVVDHFRKTIEVLLEYGADPCIENHSSASTNVNTLIQEFNNAELSMLIANKFMLYSNIKGRKDQDPSKVMLVVDKDGQLECKNLESERKKKRVAPKKSADKELVIVEDLILKPGNADTTTSDGRSSKIIRIDKKIDLENVKTPIIVSKDKIVLSNAKIVGQAVKRKKTDSPIVIKHVKTEATTK